MNETEVRKAIGAAPVCVRYLHDVHGRVLLGAPPVEAKIVPASALLSKAARSRWLAAATLATTAILFEACGGNDGGRGNLPSDAHAPDAASPEVPPRRYPAMPEVVDASSDAADLPDATDDASDDPDAGP